MEDQMVRWEISAPEAILTCPAFSVLVLLLGRHVALLVDVDLALLHQVLDDFRGALMLLHHGLEVGDLLLELVELLELGIHFNLALLLLEFGILDLGCGPAALGADFEEVSTDALAH